MRTKRIDEENEENFEKNPMTKEEAPLSSVDERIDEASSEILEAFEERRGDKL